MHFRKNPHDGIFNIAPLIGAALIGGGIQAIGGMIANNQAKKEAERNRNFQADMSNTSHVREVNDLKAAGLNPMLSANSGASTPTGAMAQTENVLEGTAATAMDTIRLKKEIAQVESQSKLNLAQGKQAEASAAAAIASAKEAEARTKIIKMTEGATAAESKLRKREAEFGASDIGFGMKRANEATEIINNVIPRVKIQNGGGRSTAPKDQPPGKSGADWIWHRDSNGKWLKVNKHTGEY